MLEMKEALPERAARLIADSGLSWSDARRKLLEEDRYLRPSDLPDDKAIEHALREHYAIFKPEEHAECLYRLRRCALWWMEELSDYRPRLIRGVLNGCADRYSHIYLEITAEDAKEIEIRLLDMGADIEVLETNPASRRDPIEEILIWDTEENPEDPQGVVLRIYETTPAKKKSKTEKDTYQCDIEAQTSADIDDLKLLLRSHYGKEENEFPDSGMPSCRF